MTHDFAKLCRYRQEPCNPKKKDKNVVYATNKAHQAQGRFVILSPQFSITLQSSEYRAAKLLKYMHCLFLGLQ